MHEIIDGFTWLIVHLFFLAFWLVKWIVIVVGGILLIAGAIWLMRFLVLLAIKEVKDEWQHIKDHFRGKHQEWMDERVER